MSFEQWIIFISFTIAINIVMQVLAWKIGHWLGYKVERRKINGRNERSDQHL